MREKVALRHLAGVAEEWGFARVLQDPRRSYGWKKCHVKATIYPTRFPFSPLKIFFVLHSPFDVVLENLVELAAALLKSRRHVLRRLAPLVMSG